MFPKKHSFGLVQCWTGNGSLYTFFSFMYSIQYKKKLFKKEKITLKPKYSIIIEKSRFKDNPYSD